MLSVCAACPVLALLLLRVLMARVFVCVFARDCWLVRSLVLLGVWFQIYRCELVCFVCVFVCVCVWCELRAAGQTSRGPLVACVERVPAAPREWLCV